MPAPNYLARAIDFSSRDEALAWSSADDIVMGGVSSSRLLATFQGTALFTGEVSLARGGGFASVRSTACARNLQGASALLLRVRGDGKRYKLRLRTSAAFDSSSYLAAFETKQGEWHEHHFEANQFIPTWRGQIRPNAAPLALQEVQSFGFLIADRQAGSFALEIAWIAGA
jgi:NADH dehydrogenase [ubiquinone] 1 alpha subcomplex assembly factor 1